MSADAARKTSAPSSKRVSHFVQSVPDFGPGSDVTRIFASEIVEIDGRKASRTSDKFDADASSCVNPEASSHQTIGQVQPWIRDTRGGSVITVTPVENVSE